VSVFEGEDVSDDREDVVVWRAKRVTVSSNQATRKKRRRRERGEERERNVGLVRREAVTAVDEKEEEIKKHGRGRQRGAVSGRKEAK
jgi:hypothetical protein